MADFSLLDKTNADLDWPRANSRLRSRATPDEHSRARDSPTSLASGALLLSPASRSRRRRAHPARRELARSQSDTPAGAGRRAAGERAAHEPWRGPECACAPRPLQQHEAWAADEGGERLRREGDGERRRWREERRSCARDSHHE